MRRLRAPLIWAGLALILLVPITLAAGSPLLEWRRTVYIAAGFAGIVGLGLCVLQPLLAGGALPGLDVRASRRVHKAAGLLLVGAVIVHVAGLWLTSPPDVVDALLFRSPTLFTPFGVVAMWAVFGAAALAALRHRRRLPYRRWRVAHTGLAALVVLCTVPHALLIDGTMEPLSKFVLCFAALLALIRGLTASRRRRTGTSPR